MTEISLQEVDLENVLGKVAIVTGGANGIGKCLVELLHRKGAITYFCDVNVQKGALLAQSFEERAHFSFADVKDWESMNQFFAEVHNSAGKIDMVFANAGIIVHETIWVDDVDTDGNLTEPELLTMDVCLKGAIFTAKLAMSYFRKNTPAGGALIFTASSSAYNERPQAPLYSASKHGVLGLMRSLRSWAPTQGVHVACVAPGGTSTSAAPPAVFDAMARAGIPVQEPEYVALALLNLASDPKANGATYALLGGKCSEVEGPIRDTMTLWYGKYNTDQALKAASIQIPK